MNLLFLDTETTSIKDPHLVQLAYIHTNGSTCANLFKPPVPIEEGASKVTGIYDQDVVDAPAFEGSEFHQFLLDHLSDSIFIAHNAKFDIGVIQRYGLEVGKYICTMKIARHLYPREPNHKLESLFTSFECSLPDGDEVKAHDALGDILMMREVLRCMTVEYMSRNHGKTAQEAIEFFVSFTMDPLLKTMPFGKHKGLPMEQLPKDYVAWLKENVDDTDILHTISVLGL